MIHQERTSTLVGLEANLDQTLSGLSTVSNSDVFLPIEKPLPYKPGELEETIVDENEEDEVSFKPNMQHGFCCPNFDYK